MKKIDGMLRKHTVFRQQMNYTGCKEILVSLNAELMGMPLSQESLLPVLALRFCLYDLAIEAWDQSCYN